MGGCMMKEKGDNRKKIMSVVVVACGLALVHLPLFMFLFPPNPCGASLGHKGQGQGWGGRDQVDSSFCCYLPPICLLFVTHHHHTWTLSLSLSPIMKIKWMVRAHKDHGRSCFQKKKERCVHLCDYQGVLISPTFSPLSDCPCTQFNFGLTLMLNYGNIHLPSTYLFSQNPSKLIHIFFT